MIETLLIVLVIAFVILAIVGSVVLHPLWLLALIGALVAVILIRRS